GGSFAGDLVYASLDDGAGVGTIHRVTIDPVTGFAIDTNTGMPQQGTIHPEDEVLATGFAPGALGLEFDAGTNDDLFVTTFDDQSGPNVGKIYQIGGFAVSTTTTTTTTIATTTTASTTTTHSTTTTQSTTTVPTTTTTSTTATTTTTRPTTTTTTATTSTSSS